MTRPTAHLKRVVDQIIVELKKIKTADGFGTNIVDTSITKNPSNWMGWGQLPAILVIYSNGENDYYGNHSTKVTKHIQFYVKFPDNGATEVLDQISELETDIEYLIEQNPTLISDDEPRGLVNSWLAKSDDSDKGAFSSDRVAIWRMKIEVVYHKTRDTV